MAIQKKKCIIPVRLPEITEPAEDDDSPSTLKHSEVFALSEKIPKIPESVNLPNFMQKLKEKFSSSDFGDSFEDYCNRALLMMNQNFEEQQEKSHRRELIRKQNTSFNSPGQKMMNF